MKKLYLGQTNLIHWPKLVALFLKSWEENEMSHASYKILTDNK